MTPKEAIKNLKKLKSFHNGSYGTAIDLAIKALEQTELNPSYNGVKTELESCEDCISRETVFEQINDWQKDEFLSVTNPLYYLHKRINSLPSVTPQQPSVTDFADKCKECGKILNDKLQTRWIPIKTRPMTEEEKEEIGHEYAYMYDCPLPDDGQDVLITGCYGNVEIDTFYRDPEGFYFETNCDDGEVIAWMPFPEPYKEGEE